MANTYRLIWLLYFVPLLSMAADAGEIDLAGWIKNADGTYTKAFGEAKVTLTSPPQGITTKTTATVNTSKGLVPFEITKTANVDVSRVGKAVRGLAVLSGPLGMTATTVSLICELTTICNDAGKWMFGDTVTEVNTLTCESVNTNTVTYYSASSGVYNRYKLIPKSQCGGVTPSGWGIVASCSPSVHGCGFGDNMIKEIQGSSTSQASTPHEPTAAEWDSKQSLLNDNRFISELIDKAVDLPTDAAPTLTPDQKKRLGVDSVPTKDAQGNVTGREETITEIEAVDAGTSSNPGRVINKETKTTVKYDNNNTQISTTTNTSYTNQPEAQKPTGFEIKFDEIGQATISNYNVPSTFNAASWGTATCPPDIEVSLTNFTFSIPTTPVCSTAEMIKPFVLMIASVIAVYIIAGVKGGSK